MKPVETFYFGLFLHLLIPMHLFIFSLFRHNVFITWITIFTILDFFHITFVILVVKTFFKMKYFFMAANFYHDGVLHPLIPSGTLKKIKNMF